MRSFMASTTLGRSAILCKDYGTGDWKQPLWLACHVSLWHMIHFGGHFTLCPQRGHNSQRRTFMTWQLFTTNGVSYEFNIFLTSDYKKRWWDIYNAEHWILKLQSWFLVSQVERALNFQGQAIMISVNSLSWIINFECWNVKLNVACWNLMLAAQVECWGLKLIFGSLNWIILISSDMMPWNQIFRS